MSCISYPGCARGGRATPFRLRDTEDTLLKVHAVHQSGLTGCDMRCLAPKSRGRPVDDEETKHCCSVLSARAYGPANVTAVGLAVLGEEESVHDLE